MPLPQTKKISRLLLSAGALLPIAPLYHCAGAESIPIDEGFIRASLEEHCIKCHGKDGKVKGKVNLLELESLDEFLADSELLESLVIALEDSDMPPEDEAPLPEAKRTKLIAELDAMLSRSIAGKAFAPTPIRRMNRFQYNNAVVDLLELDRDVFQLNERLLRRYEDYFDPRRKRMPDVVKVASRPLSKDIDGRRPEGFRGVGAFPQDQRAEHGYDNQADHLTLSPLLMESFLTLSRSIVESPDLNPRESRSWNWLFAPTGMKLDEDKPDGDTSMEEAVRARLAKVLRRGFRQPASEDTLDRFHAFAMQQLEDGVPLEGTMRTVVGAILATPDFLYFYEEGSPENPNPDGESLPVDAYELATRLSLLFWGSIPDDALLDVAASGDLLKPEVLSGQIDRLLNDPRSSRFCDGFPAQWLQLDRLVTAIPDPKKYPYFYYNGYRVSMHMMLEPLLLFETVYLEDRSVMDLIDPDYTWQSEMLAANYQGRAKGSATKVLDFKRVPVDDPRRGGVITNAAVMTMTSSPKRTQPITRGAWVNAVIFNDPPEPPPADVPPLPEADEAELEKLTIRERLAKHREREDCAGCHARIDPLGFALENFGPTGVWRDDYENGRPVDPSGVLFNRHEFDTASQFKDLLVLEKKRFIRGFVAHLLSYGLGRELSPADSPSLDAITDRAMEGNDSLRTLLKAVAMSEPFLHKAPNASSIRHEN